MSVIQDGVDITDHINSHAKSYAHQERVRTGNFGETIAYLKEAKRSLEVLPTPWQNDCIYNSITEIEKIISDLQG